MSLCSDQLADTNDLPAALSEVDLVVVPALLNDKYEVENVKEAWRNAEPSESDRNFDSKRADEVIVFPSGSASMWNQYLESEVETANGQGFDIFSKRYYYHCQEERTHPSTSNRITTLRRLCIDDGGSRRK